MLRHVFPWLYFLAITVPVAAADPSAAPRPLPATTPWKLDELFQPPDFEWVDESGPVRSLFYANEPYAGKPTRVFAYFASPRTLKDQNAQAAQEKFPAVVLVHGGGGTAFREWAELWAQRGYAAIAMDLAGHRPVEGENAHRPQNRTRLADGGPNQGDEQKFGAIDQSVTEQWQYHAIAAVLRAHSLIRSFPEVDADRTAVTGISWGGYLTCITAGVDKRFKAAVPVYGCGFLHENSAWLNQLGRMSDDQRKRWITLWDPSQYLPSVSMPIFFVNGTNDFAYPLDSYMKSYEAVPGTKQIRVTVNMPHGHPPGWAPAEIGLFVDQHLRGGDPLPKIEMPRSEQGRITARLTAGMTASAAAIHFTTGDGPINKREWTTRPAQLEQESISCDAPPAETSAWFLTVTDTRGAIISSPVVLIDSSDAPGQ